VTLRGYSADVDELTPRMHEVLASAARGRTMVETARELHVSRRTIESVREAAVARLGVPNVVAAVAVLARRGEL
jgi:DNA-binding CsgD family transcriptional regulator